MKKIYYIPGIFSITLLPILGIWYLISHGYYTKLSAHDFNYIDFNTIREWRKENHIYPAYEFDNRVYKEVILNNDDNSKKTLNSIDQFVNHVIQTKDTVNGLKIHFDENSNYNEFIEVLNIFDKRNVKMYALDNNIIYFVGKDWQPSLGKNKHEAANDEGMPDLPLHYFEGWLILDGDYNEENISANSFINNLKLQFKENKIIYSAYIIFILFTILSIFIKNKKLPF